MSSDKRTRGRAATQRHRVKSLALLHLLKDKPCADCDGKFDPICMDFDHRDPAQKSFTIGTCRASVGLARLIAEATKCDVVCANCHRLRTKRRREECRPAK